MALELRTPLCRELGIDHPILSVGFGMSAVPELVAAVSNAGGCGVLGGSSGALPTDELGRWIRRVRELTDRPFGFNMIIAGLYDAETTDEDWEWLRERIGLALDGGASVLVFFWDNPEAFVEDAHRRGAKVFLQVGSVSEAEEAIASGVDAVIAQGVEAGGHVRGTTSIWELLPAVVEAVHPTPVLASGGIGDGAGIARALSLGAQGVSMGTRFVASEEAWIHPVYKERVVGSGADDTYYGELFDVGWPNAPHRALRGKTFEEWDAAGRPPSGQRPGEGTPIGTLRFPWGERTWLRYASGMLTPDFDGDPEYAPMWTGESCGVVRDVKPAAEIVRELVREAEASMARMRDPLS
jgi:nitronate monooxygenase/enoyl-[acyl-carrier protein] reductase II